MNEAKAPRIDPRFDPRFQRGYVPDAAAGAAPSPLEPRVPASTPSAPTAAVPPAPHDSGPKPAEPPSPREAQAVPEVTAVDVAAPGADARHPSVPEDEPGLAALFETPSADRPSSIAPWFVAGWGVAVVATVIGVALWWGAIASESFYSGPSNESDRWLQLLGWMVAPSLVEAGLLGLVAMLVWTGVRHARRYEEPS
ncbi:hypothetical protein [Agromyces bauzanensis]